MVPPEEKLKLQPLKSIVKRVDTIVLPYRDKKACGDLIEKLAKQIEYYNNNKKKKSKKIKELRNILQFAPTFSFQLLRMVGPNAKKFKSKSHLIRWKRVVLKDILFYCKERQIGAFYEKLQGSLRSEREREEDSTLQTMHTDEAFDMFDDFTEDAPPIFIDHTSVENEYHNEREGGGSHEESEVNNVTSNFNGAMEAPVSASDRDIASVGLGDPFTVASSSLAFGASGSMPLPQADTLFNSSLTGSMTTIASMCDDPSDPDILLEHRVLRSYEQQLLRRIPIPKSKAMLLRMKYNMAAEATTKFEVIDRTEKAIEKIWTCKNMQHMNPSGCPNCGVIHLGGKLSAVKYIKSISRQTGVSVLLPVETEQELLRQERIVAQKNLDDCMREQLAAESEMLHRVSSSVQAWWSSCLALRRVRRQEAARERSLWYHRIRKLVRLKRALDKTNLNNSNLDLSELKYRFSDLIDEMNDYISYKLLRNMSSTERIAKTFCQKLKRSVVSSRALKAYENRQYEERRLANEARVAKQKQALLLREMRQKVKKIEFDSKRWFCTRLECQGRRFASRDRYTVHMSIHKMKEDEYRRRFDGIHKLRESRDIVEREFLQRLAVARGFLVNTGVDPLPVISESFQRPLHWAVLPHIDTFHSQMYRPLYYLEVISMAASVECASRIPLDSPVVRVGSLADGCGAGAISIKEGPPRVSKIHCMFYVPMASRARRGDDDKEVERDEAVTVVDNNSAYGTYVVGSSRAGADTSAVKVSTRVALGERLTPGNIVCVGVKRNGEERLTAVEAGNAQVVFRFCRVNAAATE